MNQPYKFFYRYSKGQQKGILALFVLIVVIQAGFFIINNTDFSSGQDKQKCEEWLQLQAAIDSLKNIRSARKDTIFPFNPNYISSYKGYMLGMSKEELQKLDKFRAEGKFLNDAAQFKTVTGMSDSLFLIISPYIKFPENKYYKEASLNNQSIAVIEKKHNPEKITDINEATEADLIKVYGIGPYYSKAIIKRRLRLGAYVSMDQMSDFENITPQAVSGLKKHFAVINNPHPLTINVNTASLNQLSHFSYFNKDIARAIITRRSMLGKISKIEDLLEINVFPVEKEKIIALYLEF